MSRALWLGLPALVACSGTAGEDSVTYDPPVQLEVPDTTGLDLDATWTDALRLALATDTRAPWAAHVATFPLMQPGCPDRYAGTPDLDNDDIPDDEDGWAWGDHCTTPGDRTFGGYAFWQNDASLSGDLATPDGQIQQGVRRLIADGVVAETDALLLEVDGELRDALTHIRATGDYERWSYTSLLQATVRGSLAEAGGVPAGGYRADVYLAYTGGDAQTLEARGNVFLFEHRLGGRFDSIAMDLAWAAPASLGPDDCALEPRGWIAVRDENAFWYDLVFQPRSEDDVTDSGYPNYPYTECDGCGSVYIRGLEQEIEVCPDLGFLWQAGTLTPPAVEDFVLAPRDLEAR